MSDLSEGDLRSTARELRSVLGLLMRRLRAEGPRQDLSWSQDSAISRLDRFGPSSISELARAEGVRSQSMGATITALEGEGLVSRSPDPEDGRQSVISLTGAGRHALHRARVERQEWLIEAMSARLTPEEQGKVAEAIELMHRMLEYPEREHSDRDLD
ncbi:MAG TPA: MarR family transcriptional regulator [Thermomicrobiales bacterium]|nr:MarR family transcriptional regulator [Thermomicrobiales bacterium]